MVCIGIAALLCISVVVYGLEFTFIVALVVCGMLGFVFV